MKLFAPDAYVPLSAFKPFDGAPESLLEFEIGTETLDWLAQNNERLTAAYCGGDGEVRYAEIESIDAASGKVHVPAREAGVYTLVSEAFRNDYPIVTNWDASMNGGIGGPCEGGVDGIGSLQLNPQGDGIQSVSDLTEDDPASPYRYKTDRYAVFTDEPDESDAKVPGNERYIGETYSLYGVTDEAAIWLSDLALKLTGFPVIMRNATGSERTAAVAGLPAFQLVSGHIVNAPETHKSAASFILPPFWTPEPEAPYPIWRNTL